MGRDNMVGTTVKNPTELPNDLGADEQHSRISGETVLMATTVGNHCFPGASGRQGTGAQEFTDAYAQFQHEARQVQPAYQPNTANTDGWKATMNAWKTFFPTMCILQCFRQAVLSIRTVATKATSALYSTIVEHAWQVDQGETTWSFS